MRGVKGTVQPIEEKRRKSREWAAANKEKVREYRQSTKVKERSKLYSRKWYILNKDKAEYWLHKASRDRALTEGLEHSISVQDIIIPLTCPVLGIPLYRPKEGRTGNSPSIDRIDNTKGYTKDNIHVISWRANSLKKDASVDELEKLYIYFKGICNDVY